MKKSAASCARPTTAPIRMLEEHRDELERLTEALIEREVLSVAEIEELIGKRPTDDPETVRSATSRRRGRRVDRQPVVIRARRATEHESQALIGTSSPIGLLR